MMEVNHFVSEYFNNLKTIQRSLLQYIEAENEEESEVYYNKFLSDFNNAKITEDKYKFKHYFNMLLRISNYHHRSPNFFKKIENAINFVKPFINKYFTNKELFDILQNNKRILLYFVQEKIFLDLSFIDDMDEEDVSLRQFLYPENTEILKYYKIEFIKDDDVDTFDFDFMDECWINVPEIAKTNFQLYDAKRKIGEDDRYIFQIIREDAVEEFIAYVTKNNLSLSKTFAISFYETNPLLIKNELTLIEYAAFFGSIQIFQYLRFNNIDIKPSVWHYAIHGNNYELIHLLEEDDIISDKKSFFEKCYEESIKCYNSELAKYIRDKYLYEKEEEFFFCKMIENYNFVDLPSEINVDLNTFFNFCEYNYFNIVEFLVKSSFEFDINQKMILIF